MIYSLTWLPAVLKSAGLKVALVDGWEERGRDEMGEVFGVMCHHTATPVNGNMPSLNTLVHGRSDLPGSLSQLGLGRDGTYYVIAAGKCNHAGVGNWQGETDGNLHFIGIEAENKGVPDDPWPEIQVEAYRWGVAAILKHIRRGVGWCAGHKEYALSRGRKSDPNFNMRAFRQSIAEIMAQGVIPSRLIPAVEPSSKPGLSQGRPTLRRGAIGEWVKHIQQRAHVSVDGIYGAITEAAIRALQRAHGLVPDGIVGPKTWGMVDAL